MGYNPYQPYQPSDYNNTKTSKYNEAVSQLYRINALWQACHDHSRNGQLIKWNWDLDAMWRELSADSDEKDAEKFYAFASQIKECRRSKEKLYSTLMLKEVFLRKLQNKQGKGSSYAEDDEGL